MKKHTKPLNKLQIKLKLKRELNTQNLANKKYKISKIGKQAKINLDFKKSLKLYNKEVKLEYLLKGKNYG